MSSFFHRPRMMRLILVFVLIAFLSALGATVAVAAPPVQEASQGLDLASLLGQFTALAGVGALIAAIVNTLKRFGIVKDGDAMAWATGLNVIGILALYLLNVFAPNVDIGSVNSIAQSIAQVLVLVVGVVLQLGLTRGANEILKGAPVIGFSHAGAEMKTQVPKLESK